MGWLVNSADFVAMRKDVIMAAVVLRFQSIWRRDFPGRMDEAEKEEWIMMDESGRRR